MLRLVEMLIYTIGRLIGFILTAIVSSTAMVLLIAIKISKKILSLVLVFTSLLFFAAIVLLIYDIRQIMNGTAEFMHTTYYSVVIVFSCMHFAVLALIKVIEFLEDKMTKIKVE